MSINKAETDYQYTIEQLKAKNELKTKWLSLIAHDFKGLFSNIQLLLDAFANKSISQDVFMSMLPELNQIAEKNSKTLANTFAWVNSQADDFSLHIEEVLIHDLFLELKETFTHEIQLKELSVKFEGNNELSIATDKFLLRFILKQLFDNAIKYSNKKGVIVVIADSSSCLNKVKITIKDNGVGIKESVIKDMGTLNGSVYTGTMQEKGAGLSLVIVKDFVELLDGQITVSSIINEGSSVALSFSQQTSQSSVSKMNKLH